jgi:hypothetical protein
MSLLSALKSIGKEIQDVGKWLDDAVKFAEPIIGALDPPLIPVLQEVETILQLLDGEKGAAPAPALSEQALQALVQGTMVAQSIKAKAAAK